MFKTRLLKWSKVRIFGVAASIQTLEHEEARKGARGEKEKVEKTKSVGVLESQHDEREEGKG